VALGAGALLTVFSVFRSFRLNANSFSFNTFGYSLIVILFGGTLVRVLSMEDSLGYGFLTFRPMRYLGQISYTFYLYQVAVMDKLAEHIHSQEAVAVGGFLITFLVSAVSWHALEQPILKLRFDSHSPHLHAGQA
jgi:peptidoglycan/LPS O-acetylase OafA/YrhL